MSKLFNFFLVTLVLVLASCHSADEFDAATTPPSAPLKEVSVSVSQPTFLGDATTRLTAKGFSLAWVDGDDAIIFQDGVKYIFTYDAQKGTFTGKTPNGILSSDLAFLYPRDRYECPTSDDVNSIYYSVPGSMSLNQDYEDLVALVGSYDANTKTITTTSVMNYINLGSFGLGETLEVTPTSVDAHAITCGAYNVKVDSFNYYDYSYANGEYDVYIPVYSNANTYQVKLMRTGDRYNYTTISGENQIFTISNLKDKTLQVDFPQFSSSEITAN